MIELREDESVLGIIRPYIINFLPEAIIGGLLFGWPLFLRSALFSSLGGKVLFWVSFLFGCMYLASGIIRQARTMLIITDARVIYLKANHAFGCRVHEVNYTDGVEVQLERVCFGLQRLNISSAQSITTLPMPGSLQIKHFIEDARALALQGGILRNEHGE